jgi:HSP20 family protein
MAQVSVHKEADIKPKEKKEAEPQKAEQSEGERELALLAHPFRPFELMRRMLRWDPFATMAPFRVWREAEAMSAPDFDVKETKDTFVFKADVPGIEAKDLDVKLAQNRLSVSGKREQEKTQKSDTYYTYERSHGSFFRAFTLPEAADADKLSADLKDGVLTITIPKRPESKTKQIDVKAS